MLKLVQNKGHYGTFWNFNGITASWNTHIRFLVFTGVYLFTVIFYIECFKIVDLGICVMYQSTPSVAFPWG